MNETVERDLLRDRLDGQRRHVLTQLEGLSEEQLRRPVLPSGWSCLGLVRHLTLSDERYWFEVVVAGVAGLLARGRKRGLAGAPRRAPRGGGARPTPPPI